LLKGEIFIGATAAYI